MPYNQPESFDHPFVQACHGLFTRRNVIDEEQRFAVFVFTVCGDTVKCFSGSHPIDEDLDGFGIRGRPFRRIHFNDRILILEVGGFADDDLQIQFILHRKIGRLIGQGVSLHFITHGQNIAHPFACRDIPIAGRGDRGDFP